MPENNGFYTYLLGIGSAGRFKIMSYVVRQRSSCRASLCRYLGIDHVKDTVHQQTRHLLTGAGSISNDGEKWDKCQYLAKLSRELDCYFVNIREYKFVQAFYSSAYRNTLPYAHLKNLGRIIGIKCTVQPSSLWVDSRRQIRLYPYDWRFDSPKLSI